MGWPGGPWRCSGGCTIDGAVPWASGEAAATTNCWGAALVGVGGGRRDGKLTGVDARGCPAAAGAGVPAVMLTNSKDSANARAP